ncbi:MAG: AraC family transcriptional regulator [Deltaproteobacteria bacterium]|nr:MAG: AraC family transcriptional regulator [Deltaproteobacteria bacterium]
MTYPALLAETQRRLGHTGHAVDAIRIGPGMLALRHQQPSPIEATVYDPVICLILQGAKQVTVGERSVRFGAGEFLLVTHDLPVVSQVCEASPEAPYVALILSIQLPVLRGLYEELAGVDLDVPEAPSLCVSEADEALLDVIGRTLVLGDDPLTARVLEPLVVKELHFRLLVGPSGGMLRNLLRHDSHASHIAEAIRILRADYRSRLAVAELARRVGMSRSSFHEHFKAITARSPLQYQKELRLLEARRLLTAEQQSVSEAAYAVGYESPSQFSREYARAFGVAPSRDQPGA